MAANPNTTMTDDQPFYGSAAVPGGAADSEATQDVPEGMMCATDGTNGSDSIAASPEEADAPVCVCITQPPESVIQPAPAGHKHEFIIVGGQNNEIARWTPGIVIKYISYISGWPGNQGQLISNNMWAAATAWNQKNIGIRFQWVTNPAEAHFTVVYGGNNGPYVAEAFFPTPFRNQKIKVYDGSFTPAGLARMVNSFQHELGHVMGLRHEFADAGAPRGVRLGPENALSIMSYAQFRSIQQSDITWTQYFYRLPNGVKVNDGTLALPVHNYVPNSR